MDQNNQPQNVLPAPLAWGVPVVIRVPILIRTRIENRLFLERLRLPPRTFVSQTKMLIDKTTKRLAVGTHVFFPCFVGNAHVRVGLVIPVRLDLMDGNYYNSRPWGF